MPPKSRKDDSRCFRSSRLESVKRIHRASDELEERVAELEQAEAAVKQQLSALGREISAIDDVIDAPEMMPLAANG